MKLNIRTENGLVIFDPPDGRLEKWMAIKPNQFGIKNNSSIILVKFNFSIFKYIIITNDSNKRIKDIDWILSDRTSILEPVYFKSDQIYTLVYFNEEIDFWNGCLVASQDLIRY